MELLERTEVLEELHTLLAHATSGQGRLAFVFGEAGIGKSALLHHFRHTLPPGIPSLLGACDPLPTPRPLGPLLDMAPGLPDEVTDLLDGGRRDEVFRALHGFLRSRHVPTVLMFEDVHWADEATLDLLRFLGRRLDGVPALLLATFRDDEVGSGHPLRLLLGDVAATMHTRRLRIPALSAAAVAELARGSDVDAAELHRVTRGNPFFATEILAAGGGLPDSVRDAVLSRVARLPSDARAYLDMAAVIGDRSELRLLEHTVDAPRAGLEAALAGGMLRATAIPPVTLSFRHELARQALLDALPPTRRRELHTRVLAALVPEEGDPAPDDLALLAHHAEGAGDEAAVLRFAPAAARRARELEAHREAAAQYERALRFAGAMTDDERAELLTDYGNECETVDRLDSAIGAFREAAAVWRRRGVPERQGLVLTRLVVSLMMSGNNEEAEAASRESLALLEPLAPGRALARATVYQALLRMLNSDDEAVHWAQRGIELAEDLGDSSMLTRATNVLGTALIVSGEIDEGREQLERALELARADHNAAAVTLAFINLGSALGEMHRFIEANHHLERAAAYGRENDRDLNRFYSLSWLALTRLHLGRWHESAAAAHEVLRQPHAAISHITAHLALGRLRARRGDPDVWGSLDAALRLAEPTGTLQRLAPVRAARAEAAWLAGDPARAATEARAAYDMAAQRRHAWLVGELAYWRWKSGELDEAPADASEPYRLQMMGRPREAAAAWRALGCPYEAARALSESDDETDRAEALSEFARLGARPMLERLRAGAVDRAAARDPSLHVRLLGSPAIRHEGVWLQPPFGKTAALLYLLAYRNDWVERDELILLLWPDVREKRARASLRNLLSRIARELPYAAGIEIESRRVSWHVESDANAYRQALARGDESAPDLYRGPLLDGFHPPDLPEFDRWLEAERGALAAGCRSAMLERVRTLADDDPGAAADALAPLLATDDLDEDVVLLQMRLLQTAGRGVEALDRYRRFAERLHEEIGAEPDEATATLAHGLRREPG